MKTGKLLAFIGLIFFFGCKKSSPPTPTPGPDKISVEIDGVKYSFNTEAIAKRISGGSNPGVQITGAKGNINSSDYIFFDITHPDSIVVGTYAEYPNSQGHLSYTQFAPAVAFDTYNNRSNSAKIVLTVVTQTRLAGTFEGDVFSGISGAGTKKSLKNGKFDVSF